MEDLFARYSISEIIVFIIVLIFALKELAVLIDWVKDRIHRASSRETDIIKKKNDINQRFDSLGDVYAEKGEVKEAFARIDQTLKSINSRMDMLTESDKEDIKSYIVREHHYFVYQKGWIDDYSLECMERRFAIYIKEHGNSFVKDLMCEVRALPKQPLKNGGNNNV